MIRVFFTVLILSVYVQKGAFALIMEPTLVSTGVDYSAGAIAVSMGALGGFLLLALIFIKFFSKKK